MDRDATQAAIAARINQHVGMYIGDLRLQLWRKHRRFVNQGRQQAAIREREHQGGRGTPGRAGSYGAGRLHVLAEAGRMQAEKPGSCRQAGAVSRQVVTRLAGDSSVHNCWEIAVSDK